MAQKQILQLLLSMKLKQYRQQKDLSLKDLSKLTGLSISYLNEIEKGKKYPKVEKVFALAKAFKVNVEDLISETLPKELTPLGDLLESKILDDLPLELFGLNYQTILELMTLTPQNFSAFLVTLKEIARCYNLNLSQLNLAALRAYQELNFNHIPSLEEISQKTIKRFEFHNTSNSLQELTDLLTTHFGYKIDYLPLAKHPTLKQVRSVFKNSSAKELFLNPLLSDSQKAFILARELGYQILDINERSASETSGHTSSFQHILGEFNAAYVAGSLLMPMPKVLQDVKDFLSSSTWDPQFLLDLTTKYQVSPETLFHRFSQVLPTELGINNLFFLRMNKPIDQEEFLITKELHLNKLHFPHGVGYHEHYCRRWITLKILQNYNQQIHDGLNPSILVKAQKSMKFGEDQDPYICFSIARRASLNPRTLSCVSLGILLTPQNKKKIKFSATSAIPELTVGQTCERCQVTDCVERVKGPIILEQALKMEQVANSIRELTR